MADKRIELSDLVSELKERFREAQRVTNHDGTDTAVVTVYSSLAGIKPKDLENYIRAARQVANFNGTDTAILACYMHYRTNYQED